MAGCGGPLGRIHQQRRDALPAGRPGDRELVHQRDAKSLGRWNPR